MKDKMLVLENGKTFYGSGFGADKTVACEIVFNTSMVGYQEILSDPSYCGQMVVMSYPLIGNYGLTDDDYESAGVYMSAMIVRSYNDSPSNFRFTKTLGQVMEEYGIAGLQGIDTRELVEIIRDEGSMRAMVTDADADVAECVAALKALSEETDLVAKVSSKSVWHARTRNPRFTVVAVDCGIKFAMIRRLNAMGCNVVIVPYDADEALIDKYCPDGLLISNGPGNPMQMQGVMELVRAYRAKLPIAGVGLGCQIIALAYGAAVRKMTSGHRGANYPVREIATGKVETTVQNHAYVISAESLGETQLTPTHLNLVDGETEGVIDAAAKVVGVQFYPDGASESERDFLFNTFIAFMKANGGKEDAQKNRY